jgi:oxalate decarboxylase/phosphoglucose isomerase-like protein (cupin superfamily)
MSSRIKAGVASAHALATLADRESESAETIRIGADEARFLVTTAQSGGAALAVEVTIPAGGGPPVMHSHEPAELYRVESGELALYVEDDGGEVVRTVAGPGAVVFIPARRQHTVRNETDAPARALAVFTPAASIEAFFRAAATVAAAQPPDPAELAALAERHGIEFGQPVPSAPAS